MRPLYVSSSTYQASLVVTPQGQPAQPAQILPCTAVAGGGKTCSGTLTAPSGIDSIAITLEDQPSVGATHGNALSSGVVVAVVNPGTTTNIRATLDGIVKNVTLVFASPTVNYAPTLPYDRATQGVQTIATYVVVNALDADGNVITASGGYVDETGANVSIGLTASSLCGGACTVNVGTASVSGPGAIVPVVATLDDTKSKFSEPLTVTPSILFGNPGGTLSAATTAFVRPTSCSAYLPKYLPSDFDMAVSGNQIVVTDNSTLDPRLALAAQIDFDASAQGTNYPVGFVAPAFGASAATFSPATRSTSTLSATYNAQTLTIQSSLSPTTTVDASIALIGDGSLCAGGSQPAFLAGVTKRSAIKPIVIAGTFTEYHLPNSNQYGAKIKANPDGNLYVTAQNPDAIYQVTTGGTFTSFTPPGVSSGNRFPDALTSGPDGAIWFGADQYSAPLGRMTTTGAFTDFGISDANSTTPGITNGPDGAIWYTNSYYGTVGRITTTGQTTEFQLPAGLNAVPSGITTGSDGNLWVTESGGGTGKIARLTPQGTITEFPLPSSPCPPPPGPPPPGPQPVICSANPVSITTGPDGALWFTDKVNGIGRITTGGQISTYAVANNQVGDITAGPDGNLWFTNGTLIGTATTSGGISSRTTPSNVYLTGVTTGPDNAIWYVGQTVVGKIQ